MLEAGDPYEADLAHPAPSQLGPLQQQLNSLIAALSDEDEGFDPEVLQAMSDTDLVQPPPPGGGWR